MMVNKTKRENPQFQFRGFGGVQCESLFSTNFPTFSLSLLFSLVLSRCERGGRRRASSHTTRDPTIQAKKRLWRFFFLMMVRINKFLDDPAEEEEEGRSVW